MDFRYNELLIPKFPNVIGSLNVYGSPEWPYFCDKDLMEIFGETSVGQIIQGLNTFEKYTYDKTIYITERGLLTILIKFREDPVTPHVKRWFNAIKDMLNTGDLKYLTFQHGLSTQEKEHAKHTCWRKLNKPGIMLSRLQRLSDSESIIFIKGTGCIGKCSDVIDECLGPHTILYFEETSQYSQAESYVRNHKDVMGHKIDYKDCNGVYKMKEEFVKGYIVRQALDDCQWSKHVHEFEKANILK